jgi:signal peptidase I
VNRKKRWIVAVGVVILAVLITPSYVRAFRVHGASEAPNYLLGDLIFVNKAAYDIRLPYTDIVLLSHSRPRHGDQVMYRRTGQEYSVFKRVIGCPGDTIEMRDNHLIVNGASLRYEGQNPATYDQIPEANKLGGVFEKEIGNGPARVITFTLGAGSHASFGPVQILEDHYFLIGDNRDNSLDSRMYGAVARERILGKLIAAD